jgi:hypothetical protein
LLSGSLIFSDLLGISFGVNPYGYSSIVTFFTAGTFLYMGGLYLLDKTFYISPGGVMWGIVWSLLLVTCLTFDTFSYITEITLASNANISFGPFEIVRNILFVFELAVVPVWTFVEGLRVFRMWDRRIKRSRT